MSESVQQPLDCSSVSDVLSDYRDILAGTATPTKGSTPFADEAFRVAVEKHLVGCAVCKAELEALQQIGDLYSDYSVDALPESHFEDYGKVIRNRVTSQEKSLKPTKVIRPAPRERSFWRRAAELTLLPLAGAAAVVAAVYVTLPETMVNPNNLPKMVMNDPIDVTPVVKEEVKVPEWPTRDVLQMPKRKTRFGVRMPGATPAAQKVETFEFDPSANGAETLKKMENLMKNQGQLIITDIDKSPKAALPTNNLNNNRGLLGLVVEAAPSTSKQKGLLVTEVKQGSPAFKAGLVEGDYIVGVNEMKIGIGNAAEVVKFIGTLQEIGVDNEVTLDFLSKSSSASNLPSESSYRVLRRAKVKLGW